VPVSTRGAGKSPKAAPTLPVSPGSNPNNWSCEYPNAKEKRNNNSVIFFMIIFCVYVLIFFLQIKKKENSYDMKIPFP
jgi:hypothetical protein